LCKYIEKVALKAIIFTDSAASLFYGGFSTPLTSKFLGVNIFLFICQEVKYYAAVLSKGPIGLLLVLFSFFVVYELLMLRFFSSSTESKPIYSFA
jgi:hypothetical protein